MGEIIGELLALLTDGLVRSLHVVRTRRRLAAGRPVRVPCSARPDGSVWPAEYVSGRLWLTPGATHAVFRARTLPALDLPVGGTLQDPEPDSWRSQDWAAKTYRPPGGGRPVHLQVDSRYLPLLHTALTGPATLRKA
ncbi:hypothetical protein OG689_25100 [Kitasatospora sp. NBC_00240]|uniref:hypothetical protein n=1 Tax=Kitasatospora sp. NBC_00240 TaxID=2903567 RepID=UPI00225AAF25|nr:hypothetical protein [Kitasatospora sp. NBC_00240]MCX5212524.1 hypothetical protein [Kitasatospora sp. NBC_00240]